MDVRMICWNSAALKTWTPNRSNLAYMAFGVMIAVGVAVRAQQASVASNCDISAAAQDAIQAQTQMINAGMVNPAQYFAPGGQGSCISGVMLQSFDLSNLIPDFASLISGAIDSALSGLLSNASSSVCNSINGSINSTVGNLNGAISNINQIYANDPAFAGMVVSYNPITTTMPTNGTATYGANGNGGNAFGLPNTGANGAGQAAGGANANLGALAQATLNAMAAMNSAWGAYQLIAGQAGDQAAYQTYVNAVNAYNQAVGNEVAAVSSANSQAAMTGAPQTTGSGQGYATVKQPTAPFYVNPMSFCAYFGTC
jgi:hypothetical protein